MPRSPALAAGPAPELPAPELPALPVRGSRVLPDPDSARSPRRARRGPGPRDDRAASGPADPRGHPPILTLMCTVEPGRGKPLAAAVLARVTGGCLPRTVVLDLGRTAGLDEEACTALHRLLDGLHPAGIALRLASGHPRVRAQLADAGLSGRIGAGGIHPSVRAAVLAEYAARPGPGLVTGEVLAALLTPAEPLNLP